MGLARGHALSRSSSRRAALQGRGCGCGSTPSNLWLRPGSQFHEAFSLCQSRHAHRCPKATNNATIIAMITTKVSIIEVRPSPLRPLQRSLQKASFPLTPRRRPNERVAVQRGHRPDGRSDRNSEPNGRTLQRLAEQEGPSIHRVVKERGAKCPSRNTAGTVLLPLRSQIATTTACL